MPLPQQGPPTTLSLLETLFRWRTIEGRDDATVVEPTNGRIVIVSNRLPVTVGTADGKLAVTPSPGGLVTGLESYLTAFTPAHPEGIEYVWVGWPGSEITKQSQRGLRTILRKEHHAVPVFMTAQEIDEFYHGFCNDTIWPLFHYFDVFTKFVPALWDAYVSANERFCEAVLKVVRPGDTVWVHDYHLMLLPAMLRAEVDDMRVGFFLHIPFPDYETFRLLPREWGSRILQGLLGSDVIGFHTHDYAHYFLRCVLRILGTDHTLGCLTVEDRPVRVDTFPMGIDFEAFSSAVNTPEVRAEQDALTQLIGERVSILSVDRLDYSKGIANRLEGFDLFLSEHPDWHGRLVLHLIVVPSRESVPQYAEMKCHIDMLVGRINGRYSSTSWTPIVYQYKNLPRSALVAAYAMSDIALVTPLRDGMNLVAKEYLACRNDETGVLVLSEMAGAAMELGEAIVINPHTSSEIAQAIDRALRMPVEVQKQNNRTMRQRLRAYDVVRWAEDFLGSLNAVIGQRDVYERAYVKGTRRKELCAAYAAAKRRLILTDYDGTLVDFVDNPKRAAPGRGVTELLSSLVQTPNTTVALISGRERDTLDEWFGDLGVALAAEHGAYVRSPHGTWEALAPSDTSWKSQLLPLFQLEADRLPGSFVQEKDYSLVFHFRAAEPELASQRAKELTDRIMHFAANADIQVIAGNKVIEARAARVNKGLAAEHYVSSVQPDFILALGDDYTDEDMFHVLPPDAWTIKVGTHHTQARFVARNHKEAVDLLRELAALA